MTGNGVLQLALYLVVLLALAKPLGALHGARLRGAHRGPGPGPRVARAPPLPTLGRPARPRDGLEDLRARDAALQLRGPAGRVPAPAPPGRPAAEPAGPRRGDARLVLQHRRQLRQQHQLAGVRRRDDDELPHPDAGPDRPELRVGRGGHGDPGRVRPGLLAPLGRDDRELLGRPDADDALHPAAALVRARAHPGLPGRGPDLRRVREGHRRPAHPVRRAGDRQGRQAGPRREGPAQDDEGDPEPSRSWPSGPPRPRSPSSSSAPTAAGSST